MSSKIPVLSGDQVIKAFFNAGYYDQKAESPRL
jgi:hypothetical protein